MNYNGSVKKAADPHHNAFEQPFWSIVTRQCLYIRSSPLLNLRTAFMT
jgi:hypothetical protein